MRLESLPNLFPILFHCFRRVCNIGSTFPWTNQNKYSNSMIIHYSCNMFLQGVTRSRSKPPGWALFTPKGLFYEKGMKTNKKGKKTTLPGTQQVGAQRLETKRNTSFSETGHFEKVPAKSTARATHNLGPNLFFLKNTRIWLLDSYEWSHTPN